MKSQKINHGKNEVNFTTLPIDILFTFRTLYEILPATANITTEQNHLKLYDFAVVVRKCASMSVRILSVLMVVVVVVDDLFLNSEKKETKKQKGKYFMCVLFLNYEKEIFRKMTQGK